MDNFLERLHVEKDELRDKVQKLNDFIDNNPMFNGVGDMQRVLLVTQLNCMKMYLYTLEERIYDLTK
jgi:hypothetical protein